MEANYSIIEEEHDAGLVIKGGGECAGLRAEWGGRVDWWAGEMGERNLVG